MRSLYAGVADEIVKTHHFGRILDLGSGLGYLPIEIALRDRNTAIVGIDASSDMVRIAETNARANRIGKSVEFATGEPTNLPFPGRYFDLVASINVLHHWRDPMAVFEEVHHVLTPGGQFWICDYRRDISPEEWESIRHSLAFHLHIPFSIGPMASSMSAYCDDDLLSMANKAHFEDVTLEHRTFEMFGRQMPVFHILKLTKPAQTKDEQKSI
jgi:ubiquinone/menaquinone biosynthesis C-methylase UbiE